MPSKHLSSRLLEAKAQHDKTFDDIAREVSDALGRDHLAPNTVCDWVNGKRMPNFDILAGLAKALDLPYREVVCLWLMDQTQTDEAANKLRAEVFKVTAPANDPLAESLNRLNTIGFRNVGSAARRFVEKLNSCTHDLLGKLASSLELHVTNEKSPARYSPDTANFTSLRGESKISKLTVFTATQPVAVVGELHRFPPKTGGLHRQGEYDSAPPCHELWSVSEGQGILLVHDGEKWVEYSLKVGECGSYWGAHRHVWLNTHPEKPLTIYHVFVPYRKMRADVDEAVEFSIDKGLALLPPEVRSEVERVRASLWRNR